MALIETYVDPDNSAGTDYTSLSAWEAGEQTDLVTDGDSHKVWCKSSSGTADTTAVTLAGWTTSATNTITINGDGPFGDYELVTTSGHSLRIEVSYTTVNELIVGLAQSGSGYRDAIHSTSSADYLVINRCFIYKKTTASNTSGANFFGITTVRNSMAFGNGSGIGFRLEHGNSVYENCTSYGWQIGFYAAWVTPLCRNNLSYNNPSNDFVLSGGSYAEGSDYNFSEDDTAPGANSIHGITDSKTPDFVSTTSGSEDFHLQSTSDAIGAGTDLSAYFTVDIDGDTRSNWDIGADEYVALATTALTNYYYTHLMQGGL